MGEKVRFPYSAALVVACRLVDCLRPFCERIVIAGSLRRHRAYVGNIEILYIPKFELAPQGFFGAILNGESPETKNMADYTILKLIESGILAKRKNVNGSEIWGENNKLAVDNGSGIPVDFFATTPKKWFMSLVIRTGGKQTNIALATGSRRRGLKLNPYGEGYTELKTGRVIPCHSEHEVFKFAGASHLPPEHRP